jgi:hypothetical protein
MSVKAKAVQQTVVIPSGSLLHRHWKIIMLLIGKPYQTISISMGHRKTMAMLVITRLGNFQLTPRRRSALPANPPGERSEANGVRYS